MTNFHIPVAANKNIKKIFGTSYFYFLKYNVYSIDGNIDNYIKEIHNIKSLFLQRCSSKNILVQKINQTKLIHTYRPQTALRIYNQAYQNFYAHHSTEQDKLLIALAYWQICRLSKSPSLIQFLLKGIKGGDSIDHQFMQDGGRFTCVDTSAITAKLCQHMGIEGKIKHDGIGSIIGLHHFYETKTGRIIDVPFGLIDGGFFYSCKNQPKTYKIVVKFVKSIYQKTQKKFWS